MTDEQEKKKIRPLYSELQGYLSHAPKRDDAVFYDSSSEREQLNATIDLLSTTIGKDYSRFKLSSLESMTGNLVYVSAYKQKLAGLINYLHGEYFSDEPSPFTGVPSTVINQNQSQQQAVSVLILDIQKKIDEKLSTTEDEKEKGFLKKLEKLLPTVTNGVQLVKAVADLAVQMGLDPHLISKLFT